MESNRLFSACLAWSACVPFVLADLSSLLVLSYCENDAVEVLQLLQSIFLKCQCCCNTGCMQEAEGVSKFAFCAIAVTVLAINKHMGKLCVSPVQAVKSLGLEATCCMLQQCLC